MSTADTKPPPFYCPACGKKHRADLSAISGQEGAFAKVDCHRCKAEMTIRIGSDGLPKCEIRGAPPSGATPGALAGAHVPGSGGIMSSLPLQLLAAAVVAGVVGFLAATLAGGGGTDDAQAARVTTLEKELAAAKTSVARLEAAAANPAPQPTGGVADLRAQVQALRGELERIEKLVSSNAAGVESLGKIFRTFSASFEKLENDYKALNGRIEANYQKGREVERRLGKLEPK